MNKFWNKIKRPFMVVLFFYVYWVLTGNMANAILLAAIMTYIEVFIRKKKTE